MVKSKLLDWSSLINKSLLLVSWREAHESKYYILFGAYCLVFLAMFTFPSVNNPVLELLLMAFVMTMLAEFYF